MTRVITLDGDADYVIAAANRGEPQYVVDMLRDHGGYDHTSSADLAVAAQIAAHLGCELLWRDTLGRYVVAERGGYWRRAARAIVAVCGGQCATEHDGVDRWLDPRTHDPYVSADPRVRAGQAVRS